MTLSMGLSYIHTHTLSEARILLPTESLRSGTGRSVLLFRLEHGEGVQRPSTPAAREGVVAKDLDTVTNSAMATVLTARGSWCAPGHGNFLPLWQTEVRVLGRVGTWPLMTRVPDQLTAGRHWPERAARTERDGAGGHDGVASELDYSNTLDVTLDGLCIESVQANHVLTINCFYSHRSVTRSFTQDCW